MAAKRKVWDYIFLHKRTPWKPEVLRIAAAAGQSRRETWAAIAEFWCWVDDNCEDGFVPGADVPFLSQVCPGTVPEFWAEMSRVGWIEFVENGARIPNFDRWMGTTAKKRNAETRRKSVKRSETGQDAGQQRDKGGTKSGTRAPQERETERETDNKTLPVAPAKPEKPRARDELFDAIVEVTHLDPKLNGSQIGKVATALRSANPPYTPEDVRGIPAALEAGGLSVPITPGVIEKYISWVRNPAKPTIAKKFEPRYAAASGKTPEQVKAETLANRQRAKAEDDAARATVTEEQRLKLLANIGRPVEENS